MDEVTAREPREVFDDHLQQGQHGTVEEDLSRNYAPARAVRPRRGCRTGPTPSSSGGRIQAQTIHYTVLPPPAHTNSERRDEPTTDSSGGIDHG